MRRPFAHASFPLSVVFFFKTRKYMDLVVLYQKKVRDFRNAPVEKNQSERTQ